MTAATLTFGSRNRDSVVTIPVDAGDRFDGPAVAKAAGISPYLKATSDWGTAFFMRSLDEEMALWQLPTPMIAGGGASIFDLARRPAERRAPQAEGEALWQWVLYAAVLAVLATASSVGALNLL